jgi:hypothetical protein
MLPCCIITSLTIGLIGTLIVTCKKFVLKMLGRSTHEPEWERPTRDV